jgi:cytochrome c peroxidase
MSKTTFKLRIVILLAIILPLFVKAVEATSSEFDLKLPLGISFDVWSYYVPKDNALNSGKVELGRQLFFDKRLSSDGSVSCALCHDPERAFTDGKRVAEGIGGRKGSRNSPTLLNAMFNSGQFWDGRVETLEAQAKLPLINPDEMGDQSFEQIIAKLKAIPEYTKQFQQVFNGPVTIDVVARAIASYERTLVSGNSPLDRYQAGDFKALGDAARNGMMLFRGKARCVVCHTFSQSFPFLTDGNYRNTGVSANFAEFDSLTRRALQLPRDDSRGALDNLTKQTGSFELGRFLVTTNVLDIGAYRTPSLRNVELTAPYFHDGSAAALEDVVRFYVNGGKANSFRDWQLEPVNLSEEEQRDVVEFLKSLTSDDARRVVASDKNQ